MFFLVINLKKTKKIKYKPLPKLYMKKDGITFTSTSTHRLKIENKKTMQIGNVLYFKTESKLIIISNVKEVRIVNEYLYFTALGNVKFTFDCEEFFRYFALSIKSQQFNLDELKQSAICDLINNNFDINFCKNAKNYINIIEKVLNICIFQEKIIIKPNKFKLSFTLTYKLNNKIKRIIINETV